MSRKIILFFSLWTVFSMQEQQNPLNLLNQQLAVQNQQQNPLKLLDNAMSAVSASLELWDFENNNSALYGLVMKFLACLVLQTIWLYFVDTSKLGGIQWLIASIGFLTFLGVLSNKFVYIKLTNKMTDNGVLSTSIMFLQKMVNKISTLPQKCFTKMVQKILQLSQNMSTETKCLLGVPLFVNIVLFLSIQLSAQGLYIKLAFDWYLYLRIYVWLPIIAGPTLATIMIKIAQLSNKFPLARTLKTGTLLFLVWLSNYWLAAPFPEEQYCIVTWPRMILYVSPLLTLGVHHHLVALGKVPNANSLIRKLVPASIFEFSFTDKIQKACILPFTMLMPWFFYFPPFPYGYLTILLVIQVLVLLKLRFLLGFVQ